MNRRHLMATTAGILAAATTARADPPVPALIDTNVSLGRWPFRRLPLDETAALVAKLRSKGVVQAWAGSFDALIHKDITAINERLSSECRGPGDGLLLALGAINPTLPDWEHDLRRCAEIHAMPGIRLHPNYHGYQLSDPVCEPLIARATQLGLFIQIAVILEEERTIHPLVNVPATGTLPLMALVKQFPAARIQVLNGFRTLKGQPLIETGRHRSLDPHRRAQLGRGAER